MEKLDDSGNKNTQKSIKFIKKGISTTPTKERKTEKRPDHFIRYDQLSHFPEIDENSIAVRCKKEGCTFKTNVFCVKCKVHLCFIKGRNCFRCFHDLTSVSVKQKESA